MRMEKYTSTSSYVLASFIALLGQWNLQEWAVVIGIFLGIATYVTNFYFKRRAIRALEGKGLTKERAEQLYDQINRH